MGGKDLEVQLKQLTNDSFLHTTLLVRSSGNDVLQKSVDASGLSGADVSWRFAL